MNIKLRAIGRTLGLFAIATLVPLLILELFQLESDTLYALFLCTFVAWMVWVVYQINLGQLETEEKVKEIQDRRDIMMSSMIKDKE